jgi:hypothetical protein
MLQKFKKMIHIIKTCITSDAFILSFIFSSIVFIWIIIFVLSNKQETQIIQKLENYRQKIDILNTDIENSSKKLQDKIKQKDALLEIMECELNQLVRL